MIRFSLAPLCAGTLLTLLSCRGVTDAEWRQVNPRLTDLKFTVTNPTAQQALEVVGTVAWGEELRPTDFAIVTLRTSSGEREEARLTTGGCRSPTGARIACDLLLLSLHEGRSPSELDTLLKEIDAQWLRFWRAGAVVNGTPRFFIQGSIQVFSGDLEQALNRVAQHPAVRIVEYDFIFELGLQVQQRIRAAVRTNRGSSASRAPTLLTFPGDSVIAEYRQPDGSLLQALAVVQN